MGSRSKDSQLELVLLIVLAVLIGAVVISSI
jgi:hypothetical protein